jgi:hypothetical protein
MFHFFVVTQLDLFVVLVNHNLRLTSDVVAGNDGISIARVPLAFMFLQ